MKSVNQYGNVLLGPCYVDGLVFTMNNLHFKGVVKIIFNVYVVFLFIYDSL
ncbi:hypothetical protein HanIR_Chr11g0546541 [Helianthus annuus]|nr:hypothetical protein HanIR_Chr11g0546541 [Helianthus annuus]